MASRPDIRSIFREYFESLLIAILLALVIRSFVLTAYKIPTSSMLPTLKVGDFVFAYKLPFGLEIPFSDRKWVTGQMPKRGEIVVFRHPMDRTASFIKRVVGLPGDRVEIREGKLFVNQIEVGREPLLKVDPEHPKLSLFVEKIEGRAHLVSGEAEDFPPTLVPPGAVFVMGDQRQESEDSRSFGPVPLENLEGRIVLIWMSLKWNESNESEVRWDRVFKVPR